ATDAQGTTQERRLVRVDTRLYAPKNNGRLGETKSSATPPTPREVAADPACGENDEPVAPAFVNERTPSTATSASCTTAAADKAASTTNIGASTTRTIAAGRASSSEARYGPSPGKTTARTS